MKKVVFLSIMLMGLLSFSSLVNGQKVNKSFTSVQVAGDTSYFNLGRPVDLTTGTISYTFATEDVADSLSYARIEGSRDGIIYVPLTGTADMPNTSTDGNKEVYVVDNLRFTDYRLALACALGDTVNVTNIGVIFKEK